MSGSRQLLRLCKSIPLPHLKQGSTLSIRCPSHVKIPFNVKLLPEWRDDAQLSLHQTLPSLSEEEKVVNMDITSKQNEDGTMTSMGRVENHILVDVDWKSYGAVRQEFKLEKEKEVESINEKVGEILLEAKIPEKCNVTCHLHHDGDISIPKGKIEGDVEFHTNHGNIAVSKLRGHNIALTAASDDKEGEKENGRGTIHVAQLIEAKDVDITAENRIRAKMINGSNVNVNLNRMEGDYDNNDKPLDDDDGLALIDIGSLYASSAANSDGARLSVSHPSSVNKEIKKRKGSDVRIKSHHGHVSVRTTSNKSTDEKEKDNMELDGFGNRIPLIDLGGVNGSCDIGVEHNDDSNNLVSASHTKTLAARVHIDSFSPESISLITSYDGDVELTVDRKVEADMRFLSCPSSSLLHKLDIDSYLSEDDKDVQNALNGIMEHGNDVTVMGNGDEDIPDGSISIQTGAFTITNKISTKIEKQGKTIEYMEGYVENKSHEPDSRFDVRNRVSVGKVRLEGAASQALKGFSGNGNRGDDAKSPDRPLLAVAASDGISVETVSWFGSIARRYGLEDGGRELGRQAMAGGAKPRRKEQPNQ